MHLAGLYSELLLASTSSARRSLMTGLGLPFRAISPEVDEDLEPNTPIHHGVALLAERKARAVHTHNPGSLVIGADQLVSVSGHVLGKPANAAAARIQLKQLRGKTHEIVTGLCVVGPAFLVNEIDVAMMTVVPLTDAEIDGYVATNEWQGCSGGYRVEGRGQAIFSRIEGDRTAIQGLPMQRVVRILREAGIRFF